MTPAFLPSCFISLIPSRRFQQHLLNFWRKPQPDRLQSFQRRRNHVCAGVRIGQGCSLGQNVFVGNRVIIGGNVKIQNNVSIYKWPTTLPTAAAEIDWSRGHEFLDQELAQVVRDAELGRRLLDNLARVATRDGQECWVFSHIELRMRSQSIFGSNGWRMLWV